MANLTNIQITNLIKRLNFALGEVDLSDTVIFTEGEKQTLEHIKYNPITDKVEADRAIETTLNSIYLGEQHKMSSGSENIYFTNMSSNTNWYPMWGGIKDQSLPENQTDAGLYAPSARVFGPYGVKELGGQPVLGTAIPYEGNDLFENNMSCMGITTVVAEEVPAHIRLKYELSVDGTPVYNQILKHNGLVVNQTLSWVFDHPLDILAGSTNHASIRKIDTQNENLELLLVCQGDNTVTGGQVRYQTDIQNRGFEDKTIAYIDDLETLDVVGYYDLYVDPSYVGTDSDGTNLRPYTVLAIAITASEAGNKIFIKGDNIITDSIIIPHSLSFYGIDGTKIRYANYSNANNNLLKFTGTDNTAVFIFKNIEFNYAGKYAINITGGAASVDIIDCKFRYNGWNGANLNTVVASSVSTTLGYDSTQADLQAFYTSTDTSNGGAMLLETITNLQVVGNKVLNNLRGIKLADCGINGNGFITRNVSAQNIDSGIYLGVGSLSGCQNITVTMNFSSYNANNGMLVIGGINNKFSQNEVNGNWNAGFCAWSAANTTLRDCGLYNNNRSAYTGIGNIGDAKASIQINENFDNDGTIITLNTDAQFICEILDTQVHNTGLVSNSEKIGFLITTDVGNLADNETNIIKIDDVGFIGQDYAIDLSEVDISNLRLSLGDNSYQSIGSKAVKVPLTGNYSELPFSNHVMSVSVLDVVVDTLKHTIYLKDGIGGNVINTYNVNDLKSIINGSKVDIIQNNSNKIQLRGLTYSNVYINGVIAGNTLSSMNDSLNGAFNMDLIEYKEFLTSEVGLNSEDDILPVQANNWYISYGTRTTEQILVSSIETDLKDLQPFYNGDSLEKGHEFIWTHDNTGSYIIGIYTGTQEETTEDNIFSSLNWGVGFKYVRNSARISGSASVGVTINSNNDFTSNQWDITNNTSLALRYGNDNYLYLLDITSGSEVIIGRSNLTQIGDSVTIFFGGENQPNAKFPVMQERNERWTIVHDLDNSESNEWIDGIEPKTILKSNMSISPGEKFTWTLPGTWSGRYYSIGYTGASTGVNSTNLVMTNRWRWHSTYILQHATSQGWIMNTSNSLYNSGSGQWNPTHNNSTLVSYRHLSNNTLEMWDETYGEKIMTLGNATTGPIHLFFGAEAYGSTYSQIPFLTKYSIDATESSSNVTAWYYIESPDGSFYYPLFKNESESNFVDTVEGGGGTSHTHTFLDDLSNTTWYMPDTNGVHAGPTAPQHGVFGNSVNVLWNEQVTGPDYGYAPTFNNITYIVQEGSAINIQYKPSGDTNTYNIQNVPTGYADNGYSIIGTAEDISNGYGQSVQHVINVTKANNFGSAQGTITINVLADLAGNEFTLVDQGGAIKFTQDGGLTVLDFNTVTFNAGSTYKFYVDGLTLQTNDFVNIIDSDGNGLTSNDGLTQSGGSGPGYAGTYFQYVIPSDVAPGKFIKFTDGATSTDYADVPLVLAGSSYSISVTGVTNEGPADLTLTTEVTDDNWYSIDENLSAGERIVITGAFLTDVFNELQIGSSFIFGVKDGAWDNTQDGNSSSNTGFEYDLCVKFKKSGASGGTLNVMQGGAIQGANVIYITSMLADYNAIIEITADGNNIRMGVAHSSQNASTDIYSDWNAAKFETGDQGYGLTSIDVLAFYDNAGSSVAFDYDNIDWTLLSEIPTPVAASSFVTNWTKAIDFNGGSEYLKHNATYANADKMPLGISNGTYITKNSNPLYTATSSSSRPWATTIVFKADGNNSRQTIWNNGEGFISNQDNFGLEIDSNNTLWFYWSHGVNSTSSSNRCYVQIGIDTSKWYGVYIAHKGGRLSSADAIPANLGECFDIRVMSSSDNFASISPNRSGSNSGGNWQQTGRRMDKTINGVFTIGASATATQPFYGKVASSVITTLKNNSLAPVEAEIKMMITDPIKWQMDHKQGTTYRLADSSSTASVPSAVSVDYNYATQIHLMGDSVGIYPYSHSDAYPNIFNNLRWVTATRMVMQNMVANDIENVSIPGLS